MKKLLPLLSLLWLLGGNVWAQTTSCTTTITTFPYYEGFEGPNHNWTTTGTNNSWALGTPAKAVINSAGGGTKSWVTNLTGLYNASEDSYVNSPCFDFTNLTSPNVELKVWWNSEFSWDGAVLQSSINNGTSWQVVGAVGDPNNWYNDNSLDGRVGGQSIGWAGRNSTSNGSGGWVVAKHALTGLGGQSNVRFRIAFGADGSIHDDGFAFDDFMIYNTTVNDAGVSVISSPSTPVTPGTPTPVTVTVKNYGTAPLTSATLGFRVNNGAATTISHTFATPLATNATSAPITIGNHTFANGTYTVKAWTQTPNSVADGLVYNDTTAVSVIVCNAITGTLTINKNAPATATNFTSFASAIQAISSCGISGAVTFNVVAGTGPYNEKVTIGNIPGTSATNTITFNGNGNTVTFPTSTSDALVTLNGAKYIRFNNLQMTGDEGTAVLLTNGAQNNNFTNNTISLSTSSTSTSYGVRLQTGAACSNNLFQNNTIRGGYYGIYNYGTSSSPNSNNSFTGNILRDQYYYGIYSYYTTGSLYEGNDISRPTRTNAGFMYCIYLATSNTEAVVSKNRIHNTHDAATTTTGTIYAIYTSSPGTSGSENIIKNNLIYNINCPGGSLYAIYNSGANNTYFYHNTISADMPGVSYSTLRAVYFLSASTNVKFMNNNISLSNPATTKHGIYLGSATISLVSNGNNLYVPNGKVGYHSSDKTTLADWKAANSNAYDQASVSADPQYVDITTGNLKPTNASLNNIGLALTPAVSDDVTGAVRSTTTPDAGAYEFSLAANDAALVTIVSPTSPIPPAVSQPVTATIKNNGSNALTSATITWSVNGTAQTPYSWTGNLTTNQTANVTIGNYTFPAGNVALEVCVTNPNGATDGLAANNCRLENLISCNALTGTFTINKNIPASATNFTSFASAVQAVSSCGIGGPVVFNVVAGSGPYNEKITIGTISGASATNTVTFNGNGNTLTNPVNSLTALITLDGAKYIRFDNLLITADASSNDGTGIYLTNGAQYNNFTNNTVSLSTSTTTTSYGIRLQNGTTANSNNLFQNNIIKGGYYGVYHYGSSAAPANNNQYIGNQIRDPYYYGMYLYYGANNLIEGNDISRPTRTNSGFMYGIMATTGSTGNTISKNRIHNLFDGTPSATSTIYGIYISVSSNAGSETIIKNNAIYNVLTNSSSAYAFYNTSGNGTYYYHNTVSLDNPNYSGSGTIRGMYFLSASTNVKFMNNIISIDAGTSGTKHAIYLGSATIALVSNNNNLYAPNGKVGYYSGDQTTLANWKTANSNAYDQASVSDDPLYINPATGNLRPNTVAIDNLAVPVIPAVSDDISGNPRSLTTPDPGAYEFTVPPHDVAVVAVSGPAPGCGHTSQEVITVTIKNFGSLTQTSIPVSYKVNGNPTGSGIWNGTLPPNSTANYTFTQTANLSARGTYDIEGTSSLAADQDNTNNATTLTVANAILPAMPVTLNFEAPLSGLDATVVTTNKNSLITDGAAASKGAGSTKGMIMEGIDDPKWVVPVGTTNPWTNNPDYFASIRVCLDATVNPTDSIFMTFDLKQLFKFTHYNTNFRVSVNGKQVPVYENGILKNTLNPPFGGYDSLGAQWKKIKVDLTQFRNTGIIQIGLGSSVKEGYQNGNGTANLVDNIEIFKVAGPAGVGIKENLLQSNVVVFPNPSTGLFNLKVPATTRSYSVEVTDLTGKVVKQQTVKNNSGAEQLNLNGTAKGIYILKIASEGNIATRKLIVE